MNMHNWRNWKPALIGSFWGLLAAFGPGALAQDSEEAEVFDGQWRYAMSCATCHGSEGQGIYAFGNSLRDNAFVVNAPPQTIINVIQNGRYNRDRVYPDYPGMPGFHYIRGEEARALVNYLKTGLQEGEGAGRQEQGDSR